MKYFLIAIILFDLSFIVNGCAAGFQDKYSFHSTKPIIDVKGNQKLAIYIKDDRAKIISGEYSPDYVGLLRIGYGAPLLDIVGKFINGYGMPIKVHTKSGNPFAQDIGESLSKSLNNNGFTTTLSLVPVSKDSIFNFSSIDKEKVDHTILLTINQWESDTYLYEPKIVYDFKLDIFDQNGNILAKSKSSKQTKIASNEIKYASAYEGKIIQVLEIALQDLMNDTSIRSILMKPSALRSIK